MKFLNRLQIHISKKSKSFLQTFYAQIFYRRYFARDSLRSANIFIANITWIRDLKYDFLLDRDAIKCT